MNFIHRYSGSVDVKTTVNEHRAPTDDSIRLAVEFEEKIKARVIESFVVGGNNLSATMVRLGNAPFGPELWIAFELNGVKHRTKVPLDLELKLMTKDEMSKLIVAAFSRALTGQFEHMEAGE